MCKFLMCRPEHFSVFYEINPWMKTENSVDQLLALEQWDALCEAIENAGGTIKQIQPVAGLPDMVFTANAGLILHNQRRVILSNFKHKERKGEEEHFRRFFEQHGYEVESVSAPFEGAGDALFLDGYLMGGHGFRSDIMAYCGGNHELGFRDCIEFHIDPPWLILPLIDPRFYHLDTCFCPLTNGDYLIYPGAVADETRLAIQLFGKREIEVDEDEAVKFACNAVLVPDIRANGQIMGNTVLMPSGCPKTVEQLTEIGYNVVPLDMSEFIKSGGACKCLTLRL